MSNLLHYWCSDNYKCFSGARIPTPDVWDTPRSTLCPGPGYAAQCHSANEALQCATNPRLRSEKKHSHCGSCPQSPILFPKPGFQRIQCSNCIALVFHVAGKRCSLPIPFPDALNVQVPQFKILCHSSLQHTRQC